MQQSGYREDQHKQIYADWPYCQWRNKNAVLWRFKNVVFRR